MIIEEKNVEIAKMLEWKKDNLLWNNNILHDYCFLLDSELEFHKNANWQFEAIEWIEKQNYMVEITSQECSIFSSKISDSEEDIIWTEGLTKKEAIFEALYQFSQYIKEKA